MQQKPPQKVTFPFFATQTYVETNCVNNALNNLFGGIVFSETDLLNLTMPKKKNNGVRKVCERGSGGGLECDSNIVAVLLAQMQAGRPGGDKDIDWTTLNAQRSMPVWYKGEAPYKFIFDNKKSIYAVYGNYKGVVGHAVTVRVRNNRLYLLNSLKKEPQKVAEKNLHALLSKFEPYAYVFRNDVDHDKPYILID